LKLVTLKIISKIETIILLPSLILIWSRSEFDA